MKKKKCPLCGHKSSEEERRENLLLASFVGYIQYGICPICGREVRPPWSTSWKRKWDREIKKILAEEESARKKGGKNEDQWNKGPVTK